MTAWFRAFVISDGFVLLGFDDGHGAFLTAILLGYP
jgi:hypothetical protein